MKSEPVGSRTGTATILFTDLVDSTAQRAALGEETAERVRRVHDHLLVEAVTGQNGTVVKKTGDGSIGDLRERRGRGCGRRGDPAGRPPTQSACGERAARRARGYQPRRRHLGGKRLLRPTGDRSGAALRRGRRAGRS